MTDTPRTDAELKRMADAGCPHIVCEYFARNLERELAAAKAALEVIGNECLDCKRIAREALAKIK